MDGNKNRFSVFSHSPDRGTFVAYFLGGVVPLMALGVVVERYVLSPIATTERYWAIGPIGVLCLFGGISFLSLGSFLMLRRLANEFIEQNHALAYYDPLTGLPNRRMYRERLEQCLRHAESDEGLVAVCFLDLDGFKRVNDTLGHNSGDGLLRQVAERLLGNLRLSDLVAREDRGESQISVSRLGGDEFTLVLNRIANARDAGIVADRVLEALRAPFVVGKHEVFATGSVGIAVYPFDGKDADTLLKNADTAMYWAKDRGRDNYQFFSISMNEETEKKHKIESLLRAALERDELTLNYEPVRDARSAAVTGVEVLLRWEDQELGSVSPSDFVPIAEETGLIAEIGGWVLRTACMKARGWQDTGLHPIRIGVNVSGHQLRHPKFVETVARILDESGLSAGALEFHVAESTIMLNHAATGTTLQELHDLGISLLLDGFGTGHSSLSCLRRFPIGRVKIDRSFVAQLPGATDGSVVVKAVIAMAHSLDLRVVAGGVETVEQADHLRALGCDELQGHLLSPPVCEEEFVRFLKRDKNE
jgi:diguanylate cyclase (GGDEF)-like protein